MALIVITAILLPPALVGYIVGVRIPVQYRIVAVPFFAYKGVSSLGQHGFYVFLLAFTAYLFGLLLSVLHKVKDTENPLRKRDHLDWVPLFALHVYLVISLCTSPFPTM
ncbi:MAG: hypothetical protein GY851_28685 [bacterium]|nr:hypothetical protein [bacterium]